MNQRSGRLAGSVLLAMSLLTALTFAPPPVQAQSNISGNVINESKWDNTWIWRVPGDGSTNGSLCVGLWGASGNIVGPPSQTNVLATGVLPFGWQANFPYTMANVAPGSYQLAAWIDGNANGSYDAGEPRSAPAGVTVATNNVPGINVTVVDDVDGDGMADWWEVHWFGTTAKGGEDTDRDGLSNVEEFEIAMQIPALSGINPARFDTDNDGMDDGWEYRSYAEGAGPNPCVPDASGDADGDGLSNIQEYNGIDGWGVLEQDPTQPSGVARRNPRDSGDALNPIDIDTDGDYLIDSFESAWYDPANGIDPRTPGDYRADSDLDGLTNYREQCLLAELAQGGTNDIWSRGVVSFPTTNGAGVRAFSPRLNLGVSAPTIRADAATGGPLRAQEWTDPTHGSGYLFDLPLLSGDGWDSDNDRLPDGWEVEFSLDPKNGIGDDGYWGDPDGDGLINYQEYLGQDGNRPSYVNGSGDETNPNEYNWRPDDTGPDQPLTGPPAGYGVQRPVPPAEYWYGANESPFGTLGAARPTERVGTPGFDRGTDTDDDGLDDDVEIQREYTEGIVGSSPVHSMDPFIRASARIVDNAGIPLPDPEGNPDRGYLPMLHQRNWTVECHVKIDAPGRSGYLIDCTGDSPGEPPSQLGKVCFRLELTNDVPRVLFDTIGRQRYMVSGLGIPTNRWTHLAGVWNRDANSLALYVDGIFVQEQRVYEDCVSGFRFPLRTNPVLGASPDGTFAGHVWLDEIRIWGVARTAAQIEDYRTRLVPQDTADLKAYYRFDDRGTCAEDFVRKSKTGLVGAPSQNRFYGDFGYALRTNAFVFATNDYAEVRGVDPRGADDSDGDGLPDGWELINHLDPKSAAGEDGADGDPDRDGLSNLYEFRSQTNPRAEDTNQDGILDGNEDYDGDGLVNAIEQALGSRPDMVDTDDDGVTDTDELARGTSPTNPTDPAVPRSVEFDGAADDYLTVPNSLYQRLTDWTLEAWVKPASAAGGAGSIVRRLIETPPSGRSGVNYMLALQTNALGELVPYAGYSFANGTNNLIVGPAIPANLWTHLAASCDSVNKRLTLYTNGFAATNLALGGTFRAPPTNGKGGETSLRIGEDFEGRIDEVRVWNDVRTPGEIRAAYAFTVEGTSQGLVHSFRMDDSEAATNASLPEFYWPEFWPHGAQDFTREKDWNEEWRHAALRHGATRFVTDSPVGVPPSLSVTIEPAEAHAAGGQWAIDSGGWRNSGDSVTTVAGAHTISFRTLFGWATPSNQIVVLANNQATNLVGRYVQNGSVRVFLEPDAAVAAGAQWAVDGGAWQASGAAVSNLTPGSHTISCRPLPTWVAPASENVTVNSGEETVRTLLYTPITGSLRVTLQPPAVVVSGAVWQVDSGAWQPSGAIVSNITLGNHTVGYRPVPGWQTPLPQTIVVSNAALIDLSATYEKFGALCLVLEPLGAVAAGAQWRIGAGGSWMASGVTQEVARGNYTVFYKVIDGWLAPGDPLAFYSEVFFVDTGETVQRTRYYEEVWDSDGDGLPDWWEYLWFGNLNEAGAGDFDKDGLTNLEEFNIASNTPALNALSPIDWDSDGDRMDDRWEYLHYAGGAGLSPVAADAAGDVDGDGLSNWQEYLGLDGRPPKEQDPTKPAGIARTTGSADDLNPLDIDTDGDRLVDSFEAAWYDSAGGVDPRTAGLASSDSDGDGLSAFREQCLLLEFRQGGVNDIWTQPLPASNVVTGLRAFAPPLNLGLAPLSAIWPFNIAALRAHEWTDPTPGTGYAETLNHGADTDGDNLPDGWEVEFGLVPTDPGGSNGALGDPDGDDLTNWQEFLGQDGSRDVTRPLSIGTGDETNPNVYFWGGRSLPWQPLGEPGLQGGWDTDDDGIRDGEEIQREYQRGLIGASPVHSMDPFVKRSARILSDGGLTLPSPTGYGRFETNRQWTLECAVKIVVPGCSGSLVDCTNAVAGALGRVGFRLALSNDVPVASFDTVGGQRYAVAALPIPTNRWTFLSAVWSPENNCLNLYVDGIFLQQQRVYEESVSGGGSAIFQATPPRLALSPDGTFSNRILLDEVRIWNVARSEADVEAYRTRLVPQDSAGLIAYFRFDDGGQTAEDFTRKATDSLTGQIYLWGDFGYALKRTNELGAALFAFATNDFALVRGVDPRGADDSDGDGLPDPWELINHLNLTADDSALDPDGDRLSNLYEFWSQTNPNDPDTDRNGVLDRAEDLDGDGVSNLQEQEFGSRPDLVDTDDDGRPDSQEQSEHTSPIDAQSPPTARCASFGGGSDDYFEVPNAMVQRLTDWTLEAWVSPAGAAEAPGVIVERVVETPASGSNGVNYVLGLETNAAGAVIPYAGYSLPNGPEFRVRGAGGVPVARWTHLCATYESDAARLTIYTNGILSAAVSGLFRAPPINGRGGETHFWMGRHFGGLADEVRVWNYPRSIGEIQRDFGEVLMTVDSRLVHYFRFDDGEAQTNAAFAAFTEFFQPQGAQDWTVADDWSTEWSHAARPHGKAGFADGGPLGSPPSLSVVIEPPEVRGLGAGWQLSPETNWLASGDVIVTTRGTYTIHFNAVTNWIVPSGIGLTLSNNASVVVTGTYVRVQPTGLQVFLGPPEAVSAGARWRLSGGEWHGSGVFTTLAAGPYTVQFTNLTGWIKPPDVAVVVSNNMTAVLRGAYQGYEILGGYGTGLGQFNRPRGLAILERYLYVADSGNDRVQVLDLVTEQWGVLGSGGSGLGQFRQPLGLGLDSGHNLWVADGNNHRIQRLDAADGTWMQWGSRGSSLGQFVEAFDVAVDSSGNAYVADHYNHRVQRLDAATGAWSEFVPNGGADGRVRFPNGLAVEADTLYVSDYDIASLAGRVQAFSASSGQYLGRPGSSAVGEGELLKPMGLGVGRPGGLLVADQEGGQVRQMIATGVWQTVMGSGLVAGPVDVAVDVWGSIYVADYGSNRIVRLLPRDADGDGLPDWVEDNTGVYSNRFHTGTDPMEADTDGDGATDGREVSTGRSPLDPTDFPVYVPSDFDGDGNTDFSVFGRGGQSWAILGSRDGVPWTQTSFVWGDPNDVLVPMDYDGDGLCDVATFRRTTGLWRIWYSTTRTVVEVTYGQPGDIPVPADYDRDGRADIAVFRVSGNSTKWFASLSGGGAFYKLWGVRGDIPVPGDYDGDGIADPAIFRPSSGQWRVSLSGGGGINRVCGNPGDVPVPGDYDGDGITDLAAFGRGDAVWHLFQSSLGVGTVYTKRGNPGDVPVPGDYDRDGEWELAVLRGGSAWYYWPSAASGKARGRGWGWAGAEAAMPQYQINRLFKLVP